jgi:hypothetical protein
MKNCPYGCSEFADRDSKCGACLVSTENTEIRGWRAEALIKILTLAWEAASEGRAGSAMYWQADAAKVVETARPIQNVDGSVVWA